MTVELLRNFFVQGWEKVKLKYWVIERFRGEYSAEAMGKVFEISRSGYYAGVLPYFQPFPRAAETFAASGDTARTMKAPFSITLASSSLKTCAG